MKNFLLKILTLILIISSALCVATACKEGGDTPPHECTYTKTVVAPTCTEQGYTLNKCSCGEEYKDNYTTQTGHIFSNYVSDNNATCIKNGTKTAVCDSFGCNVINTITDVDTKLGHDYNIVVTVPTCTSKGYTTYTCKNDSTHTYVDNYVNELSHSFTNYVLNGDATCTQDGTKTATCDRNGCNVTNTIVAVDSKLGHSYANYVSDNNATCTVDGTKTGKCIRCEETNTITEENSASGHSEGEVVVENSVAPTCTEDGSYDNVVYCTVCKTELLRETITVDAIGHSFNNYISNNDGTKYQQCSCGESTDLIVDENVLLVEDNTVIGLTEYGRTLTKIVIPEGIISIADYAFLGADNQSGEFFDIKLQSIELPNTLLNIGGYAFTYCFYLEEIIIPNNVAYIGVGAFGYCVAIENAVIGNNVESIEQYTFANCVLLKSVKIGNSVESIGSAAFDGCSSLESVTIPDSVTSIGVSAFSSCYSLKNVIISKSVNKIDSSAFSDCINLETIWYNANVEDWNKINKDKQWASDSTFIVQCLDGSLKVDITNIVIYTGGIGGTYYAFTTGLQTQLTKKTDYTFKVVVDTGGSVANLKAINNGDCNMAIVQNDTMINAYNGLTNNFSASGAIKNFSVIGQVYPEVIQIVTCDPTIKSLADLKNSGKRVSIGDVGSSIEANAVALLQKYGIDISFDETTYSSTDITIQNLSVAKSAEAMRDDKLDVFFFTSGAPTTSITEIALEKPVYMLGLSEEVMNEFIAENKIDNKYDVYSKQHITNAQYSFIPAGETVYTIGVSATYIVSNSLSEEVVYNITKAMWESKGFIGHAVESTMDTAYALVTIGNVPVHPGAAKYYRELGITVENVAEI